MAKTYISSAKYRILITFEVDGIVDKHDVVGAVFGQSEGLLGASMDLKELQQSGKIGRIEIEPQVVNGKTTGKLIVPSSIDSVQTSLLAAAIESVDKVGPYDAKFATDAIEDTRAVKRTLISDRAKQLLQKFMTEQTPDMDELRQDIQTGVRTALLTEYGPDKIPCGPDIEKADELIVVEGRADVINLLKHGITNVVGMDGANVPQSIIDLSKTKKLIAFLDGDRGGELNLRKLKELARIESVVTAPDGKEVEELTRKEILLALKRETSAERALGNEDRNRPIRPMQRMDRGPRPMGMNRMDRPNRTGRGPRNDRGGFRDSRDSRGLRRDDRGFRPRFNQGFQQVHPTESFAPTPKTAFTEIETVASPLASNPQERDKYRPIMKELKGTLSGRLLDNDLKTVADSSVKDLLAKLKKTTKPFSTIAFDGIITKRLVDEASKKGVQTIVGVKLGKVDDAKGIGIVVLND